jgi:tetratricopeptide (TPR) repeat protein
VSNAIVFGDAAQPWYRRWPDLAGTGAFLLLLLCAGLTIVGGMGPGDPSAGLLWALACLVSGFLAGFLFGVPRVPAEEAPGASAAADRAAGRPYRIRPNTNLEQISDWLTKILVGVTLVQLEKLPRLFGRATAFVGASLGAPAARYAPYAGGMILYFTVLGFLGGYLLTRLFFAGAFSRADQSAARSIDRGDAAEVQSAQIGIDEPAEGVPTAARSAAERVQQVPAESLNSLDELRVWAKAKLIAGDVPHAVGAYRRALALAPDDLELRYEYVSALFSLRKHREAVEQLDEIRRRLGPSADPRFREQVYNSLTFVSLYLDPPEGFNTAIRYGREYVDDPRSPRSGPILANLAAAYGQQARCLREQGAPPERLAEARGMALEAVRGALAVSPLWSERFRLLLDPGYPGKDPGEDDLEAFVHDDEFRRELGMADALADEADAWTRSPP